MLKTVVFDFDGTLVDTEKEYIENYRKLIRRFDAEIHPEDFPHLIGKGAQEKADYLNETYGYAIDGESLVLEFRTMNAEVIMRMKEDLLYEDVRGCLKAVKDMGFSCAVCSNSRKEKIHHALTVLGIDEYFDEIYSGNTLGMRKPDPALYRYLLKDRKLDPGEIIAVEDSPGGIASSKGAGVWTVGLCRVLDEDTLQADVHIHSLSELPSLLASMNFY